MDVSPVGALRGYRNPQLGAQIEGSRHGSELDSPIHWYQSYNQWIGESCSYVLKYMMESIDWYIYEYQSYNQLITFFAHDSNI